MRSWLSIFAIMICVSLRAHAEYRVYTLTISNAQTGQSRVVTTTLDNYQYPDYFHVKRDERIQLTDTWMCRGSQGNFEPLCANPKTNSGATGNGVQAPSTSSLAPSAPAPPAR